MSIKRLSGRVPSAKFVAVATLSKHILKFHKISTKDGSGKCDAFETGNQSDTLIGVVFDIAESEKTALDQKEGLHYGYEEKAVVVTSAEGESLTALTYYATNIDPSLKPYHWYKEHVTRGATENDLPKYYIEIVSSIESISDPKPKRHVEEMAIYR